MLHEWHEVEVGPGAGSSQEVITWLFEEDSFAPRAKLTAQGYEHVIVDHLDTPLALYDARGTQTWGMELDIYGAVRQGQGQAQDCPFRYQGQYEDVETGLYYNRFRYYDPEVGQYISQDPIGLAGGRLLQGYVADPLTQVDVLGLSEGSTTLGNRMSRAGSPSSFEHGISPFPRGDFRAHHVIPHDVWTQPQNQRFFNDIGLGGAKDRAANGVFLPKSEAVGQRYGFENYHSGSHAGYNRDMGASVTDIRDRFNSGAINKTQARKEISALQKAERKRLSERGRVNGPCGRLG